MCAQPMWSNCEQDLNFIQFSRKSSQGVIEVPSFYCLKLLNFEASIYKQQVVEH